MYLPGLLLHHSFDLAKPAAEWITPLGREITGLVANPGVDEKQSTLKDAAVGTCVAQAVRRWTFPAPKSGSVEVTYPFVLAPAGTSGLSCTPECPSAAPLASSAAMRWDSVERGMRSALAAPRKLARSATSTNAATAPKSARPIVRMTGQYVPAGRPGHRGSWP